MKSRFLAATVAFLSLVLISSAASAGFPELKPIQKKVLKLAPIPDLNSVGLFKIRRGQIVGSEEVTEDCSGEGCAVKKMCVKEMMVHVLEGPDVVGVYPSRIAVRRGNNPMRAKHLCNMLTDAEISGSFVMVAGKPEYFMNDKLFSAYGVEADQCVDCSSCDDLETEEYPLDPPESIPEDPENPDQDDPADPTEDDPAYPDDPTEDDPAYPDDPSDDDPGESEPEPVPEPMPLPGF